MALRVVKLGIHDPSAVILALESLDIGDVGREVVVEIGAHADGRFVAPGAGHIAGRVASSANKHHGEAIALDCLDAEAVSLDVEIEAPQAVSAQGISA